MGDRISDDDLRRLLAEATPGPWLAANNPGDWGLAGAWSITPPNGNPYEWDQCIAHIEYTTPYCAGASKAELDAAEVAKANAHLIALSPALAAEVLQLREALRPFATVAEHDIGDAFRPMRFVNRAPKLTVGDLRRARAALSQPAPTDAAMKREAGQ